MRSKSPETMSKILRFAEEYYLKNGSSPSITKIANAVGIARGTTYRYLVEMNEKGMIQYDGNEIQTNVTQKRQIDDVPVAIVGSIPCGSPQIEEEQIDEYVSLPTSIFGKGDFYILRASGDSMVDAGIEDGNLIVINKQSTAEIGNIVVAMDDYKENTLKRFAGYDKNGYAILEYMNKEKYPNKTIKVKDLVVQGILRFIIKEGLFYK